MEAQVLLAVVFLLAEVVGKCEGSVADGKVLKECEVLLDKASLELDELCCVKLLWIQRTYPDTLTICQLLESLLLLWHSSAVVVRFFTVACRLASSLYICLYHALDGLQLDLQPVKRPRNESAVPPPDRLIDNLSKQHVTIACQLNPVDPVVDG